MKNYLMIFIFSLFCFSCTKKDNCNNSVSLTGKYENIYDKEAKNILIINKNGTYKQVFTKNGIRKINKGRYKFFPKFCSIVFLNLKVLQDLPKLKDEYHIEDNYPAKFRNNNIVFIEDLPFEFDYYRIDE
jgi:predicted AAA+ superfamily ATPase